MIPSDFQLLMQRRATFVIWPSLILTQVSAYGMVGAWSIYFNLGLFHKKLFFGMVWESSNGQYNIVRTVKTTWFLVVPVSNLCVCVCVCVRT